MADLVSELAKGVQGLGYKALGNTSFESRDFLHDALDLGVPRWKSDLPVVLASVKSS